MDQFAIGLHFFFPSTVLEWTMSNLTYELEFQGPDSFDLRRLRAGVSLIFVACRRQVSYFTDCLCWPAVLQDGGILFPKLFGILSHPKSWTTALGHYSSKKTENFRSWLYIIFYSILVTVLQIIWRHSDVLHAKVAAKPLMINDNSAPALLIVEIIVITIFPWHKLPNMTVTSKPTARLLYL